MALLAPRPETGTLATVEHVRHVYDRGVVLDDVSFELREGEIVGLLGRSGCGKSTLLRIIAGLVPATSGRVSIDGKPVHGPADGVGMVFQSFALFPWLSVLENVELGLEAKGIPRDERRRRALAAIDLIGLDGFESAYPKELSGGMRQRIGLARALVVEPNILLMDEPFSALDVLTADTLRTDLLDLWLEGRMPTRSILLVTHNIEEAVFLCDRLLLLSSNPARIVDEIAIDLPHPRSRVDGEFRALVDDVYTRMTAPGTRQATKDNMFRGVGTAMALPRVSSNLLAGLMETLAAPPFNGRADLPALAARLHMEVDELFPIAEVLHLLRFAELSAGDLSLTKAGWRFAQAGMDVRKTLFAQHLAAYVPLAAHIRHVLDERPSHRAPMLRFKDELEDHMSEAEADETLRAVIGWARFGELFAYDEQAQMLSLDDPS